MINNAPLSGSLPARSSRGEREKARFAGCNLSKLAQGNKVPGPIPFMSLGKRREVSRLRSAGPQDRFQWRLIGCLGLEGGAQQPVTFEALDQFVRVNDSGGDFA